MLRNITKTRRGGSTVKSGASAYAAPPRANGIRKELRCERKTLDGRY